MKYNDNGEYKEVVVKSVDTLPVGTEVDFDGNEVPSGWSEVSELLWENSNTAVTDTFSNQNITLSQSWTKILVVCRVNYNDNTQIAIPVAKGVGRQFTLAHSVFNYSSTKGSGIRTIARFCYYAENDDKTLTIGQCYGQDIYGSSTDSLSNLQGYLVPLKIYRL